jgi:glucokinase
MKGAAVPAAGSRGQTVPSGDEVILAGDIGGTHARLAVLDRRGSAQWQLHHRMDIEGQFDTFMQALHHYLDTVRLSPLPRTIVLAVAGPVEAGAVSLTNRAWRISEAELVASGFGEARLLNDFAALAYAAERLGPGDLRAIGPDVPASSEGTITILGPGTGFGVACLARRHGHVIPIATEGGHIGFAPEGAEEVALLNALARRFGRVSVERILSGPGLENLSRALGEIARRPVDALSAAQIVEQASGGDPHCRATLAMFCAIFGAVAGDLALAHGARGGVLLAGGIAPRIAPHLLEGAFRARFEAKGRLSSWAKSIPTKLIVNGDATLLGAARLVEEPRLQRT